MAASAASSDPARQDEASTLFEMLAQAVDLAERASEPTPGSTHTGRLKIEGQLAEGLALFTDGPHAPAGRGRIDALGHYHDTLARVRRLRLPADLREKLAPSSSTPSKIPTEGAHVLDMVETWTQLGARFDARKDPALPLVEPAKDVTGSRQTIFGRARRVPQRFGTLGAGGGPFRRPAGASEAPRPDAVGIGHDRNGRRHPARDGGPGGVPAASRGRAGEAHDVGGGHHGPAGPAPPKPRTSSMGLLKLSQLAQQTASADSGNLPPDVSRGWAGGKLPAFQAKCISLVTELASQAAAGKAFDAEPLERLEAARSLCDGLREAGAAEAAVAQAEVLARWVDSPAGVGRPHAVLGPVPRRHRRRDRGLQRRRQRRRPRLAGQCATATRRL